MPRLSILTSIVFLTCLLAGTCWGASSVKIDFVQSVYEDNQGIGLKYPEDVACKEGLFIVADTGNNRLVKYTYQDQVIKTGEFDMPVTSPIVVQINSKGEIYALDGRDRRILILNPDGTEKGYLSPKGAPVGRKMLPKSFKINKEDNIYILDLSDEVVLILDSSGNYIRHINFPDNYGFLSDVAVDSQGTVFAIDSVNAALYKAGPDDETLSLLNGNIREYANFPTALSIDKDGIIYLVDKHGGSLILLSRDGSFQGHRFGFGWKEAQFYYPSQLCISENGDFFVADRNNDRVQIFKIGE